MQRFFLKEKTASSSRSSAPAQPSVAPLHFTASWASQSSAARAHANPFETFPRPLTLLPEYTRKPEPKPEPMQVVVGEGHINPSSSAVAESLETTTQKAC